MWQRHIRNCLQSRWECGKARTKYPQSVRTKNLCLILGDCYFLNLTHCKITGLCFSF